jgi:hypothetical protein
MVEGIALATQIRRLGLLLATWTMVGSVGVSQPSWIKTTLNLCFSHAVTLDLFRVLGTQMILKMVKGYV